MLTSRASDPNKYKNISMIDVPERQRRSFNEAAMIDLENSIASHGLFHAIVLRESHILVAGERRLRAVTRLHKDKVPLTYNGEVVPDNCIPFINVESEDELHALEMELDENIIREDISWQDKVRAHSEIHKLRVARNPDQTYKQTAQEIVARTGTQRTIKAIEVDISRALVTSEFLEHPDVRSAKNEQWAFNAAARIIRDEFTAKLGKNVKSKHTFLPGKAEKHLAKLVKQNKKFNCFLIDPPYGIDAHTFHPGNSPAEKLHEYTDDIESALSFSTTLIDRCTDLSSPDAHLWMFCDVELFLKLRSLLAERKWIVFRTPLIWSKGSTGYIMRKANIRRGYEMLLFAQRSERSLSQMFQDVVSISNRTEEKIHAAQKPVELYEQLIRLSCIPDDCVLDPCCGSGTIFRAAQNTKVSATGIEQDKHFITVCQNLLVELETK